MLLQDIQNHTTISHSNNKANTNQLLSHTNGQIKRSAMHGFDSTTKASNLNQPPIYISISSIAQSYSYVLEFLFKSSL